MASNPAAPASVAMRATAHREYVLGRVGEQSGADLVEQAEHLRVAAKLYAQFAASPSWGSSSEWQMREAWSTLSLARNLRSRSLYGRALSKASHALDLFTRLGDPYGRSYSLFTMGFCLRLLGQFAAAWRYLQEAHRLAVEHSFARFEADALMQMGDVRRCQDRNDDARELLAEALALADPLELKVTRAFGRSALGAAEYQAGNLEQAKVELDRAYELFTTANHGVGMALNARRRAVVARRLAEVGNRDAENRARSLLTGARSRYTRLGSPAGVMACDIELGRMKLARHERPTRVVVLLRERLDDTPQRDLLEQDPWFPRLLAAFAKDADDPALTEHARRLLETAPKRLAGQAQPTIAVTSRALKWPDESEPAIIESIPAGEMGGEPRRERDVQEPVTA
jgi:tetratricopeptide (TPR) repeat protein